MKIQMFLVEILRGDKDDCGNPIPDITEGDVRKALFGALDDASSVTVREVEEG